MNEDLDKDTVIIAITEGVGAGFGRGARKSFYEQFDRLVKQASFRELRTRERQAMVDLLAVASFYQCVMVPIESSGAFVSVLKDAGATHLRVAGDKLDRSFANNTQRIAEGFGVLLERAKIPPHLLMYSTLAEFVDQAREFYRLFPNGPVD